MTSAQTATIPADDLADRWERLRVSQPKLRNRDAAAALGVSEAELIATRQSDTNFRLRADWQALFAGLPKLGRVMALTRNEDAVHERHGIYAPASFSGHVGLVLGADIDLRIFLKAWAYGFAVEEMSARGPLRSMQIFERSGVAIHKIYAGGDTDLVAWQDLIDALRPAVPLAALEITTPRPRSAPGDIAAIDAGALLAGWQNLRDTHEFQGLLSRSNAQPTQAFQLAEGRFTTRLAPGAVNLLLTAAAREQVPIMVFVGNHGLIQIHTGPVGRIEVMGPWLNVLDPDFNLHLRADHFAEVWHVEKPTTDGIVTSVEVFNGAGDRIVTFFGKRKPGEAELPSWRQLVAGLSGARINAGGRS